MDRGDFEIDLAEMKARGWVAEIVGELKSGKEATVYLGRDASGSYIAVKRYRPMHGKRFTTDAKYREGRLMKERDARAFAKRTRFGRQVAQGTWIGAEYSALHRLARANLAVPRPIGRFGATIVMEFIAESPGSDRPAPRAVDAEFDPSLAPRLHAAVLKTIEGMFERHVVHADLSPFNVLLPMRPAGENEAQALTPIVIDFPQAVDPRKNRHALALLRHDVEQITRFFQRVDPALDDQGLADRLWARFEAGALGTPRDRDV